MNEARLNLFPGAVEYRFLSNPPSAAEAASASQLRAQLRDIASSGCRRLVVGGGTPLSHPEIVPILSECRELALHDLVLDTEAAVLARRGTTTLLARLGVTQLMLAVGGVSDEAQQAALPGGGSAKTALEGVARALRATLDEGAPVYLVVPLLRANAAELDRLLSLVVGLEGRLQGLLLALPLVSRVPAERRGELLSYREQAEVAARAFRWCQGYGVEYGFTTKRGILPCAGADALAHFGTVFHDRFQYFRHTEHVHREERFVRVAACDECSLDATCSYVEREYAEQFGVADLKAVPGDVSMGWKLRRINRLEDAEYRNISPFKNDSIVNPRGLIRINGHCNMSCAFCFVDRTAPDFDAAQLRAEIQAMADSGTRHLVLSGGEPTLHPALAELIAYAASLGAFDVIEMQSNGVKCADAEYTRSLVEAGLNKVTISLHSVDPEHSDKITRLPKAFGKTVEAMHHFRQLGVLTQIAHVITKENFRELPDTVRYLRQEFPAEGGRLSLCLAIAQGISDLVFQWVIPTFTEIRPFVAEALDFCLTHDVGFGGMIGQGGYPPCMLDGRLDYYANVIDKVFKSDDSGKQFYKPERCRECSFDPYCLGPRRSYVEHYGEDEIRPFRAEIPVRRSPRDGIDLSIESAMDGVARAVAPPGRPSERGPDVGRRAPD